MLDTNDTTALPQKCYVNEYLRTDTDASNPEKCISQLGTSIQYLYKGICLGTRRRKSKVSVE
jgi:hypothetical protein